MFRQIRKHLPRLISYGMASHGVLLTAQTNINAIIDHWFTAAGESFGEAITELNRSREHDSRGLVAVYKDIFLSLCHARLGHLEQANSAYALAARNLAISDGNHSPSDLKELSGFFKEAQALGLER